MSGDVHVQFCERPGVRFPRATHLALFADDPARLEAWRDRVAAFLAHRRLSLHPEKTHVTSTSSPATFLGFELRPGGRRRLPEANVRRFRNRLRGLPRPLAGGHRHAGRSGAAGSRLGGARGARRYVAAAPRDLPGRVVRTSRAAGPGGLTGPRPSCGSRRLLEQQCREPPAWRAQQEHHRQPEQQPGFSRFEHAPEPEPARSRPRRARVGASRAGHDEPAPSDESGGVTAGARPGPRGRRVPAAVSWSAAGFLTLVPSPSHRIP